MGNDNTSPIQEPQEVDNTELIITSCSSEINKVLESGVNINEDGLFVEPTCSICTSPLRGEAEEVWNSTRMVGKVQEVFKNKGKKVPSNAVVESHMVNCASRSVSEIQRREYCKRIDRMKKDDLSTLDQISLLTTILTENLLSINSIVPTGTETQAEIRKIKSAETTKLSARLESLCKLRASILGEMLGDGDLIYIPKEEFINIFNRAIVNNQDNPKVQAAIKGLLDELQKVEKSS